MALFPVGSVLLVTQVLRRAADYGLGKPPREMLFTVLNPESKFKSKSLIDTVLQRGADAAGAVALRADRRHRRSSASRGCAPGCASCCWARRVRSARRSKRASGEDRATAAAS